MTKIPVISGRECVAALQRAGFVFVRQKGSHIVLRRDDPYARVVVPNHSTVAIANIKEAIELYLEVFSFQDD